MASIIQVKNKWRVQIRRKGHPVITKTFTTKALAQQWAKRTESDLEAGSVGLVATTSKTAVSDLIKTYTKEIGGKKTFGRNKAWVLSRLEDPIMGLGSIPVANLTPSLIVDYIVNKRQVSGVTASIDLTYLAGVLKVSRTLWKINAPAGVVEGARAVLGHMGRLHRSNERDRRPTPEELDKLRGWLRLHSKSLTPDIFDFILDSCFRPPSEICRLRWDDVSMEDKTILIRDRKDPRRKIGNNMTVPLFGRCMEIIARQPRINEFIFPVNGKSWSSIFPRACRELGIQDLHLYDLRHEAITRLVESAKYSFQEMMLVTGHKDPKQLMRYTQLQAKNLHGR